ncbi:GDP-L-fucose synthase (plasmid) [Paracoccaceae bacterium]|nr:GDP-L-fucose synthase [Paracoccaceae bacterium]
MTRYFVTGHKDMIGSAILRRLEQDRRDGAPRDILVRDEDKLDLTDQAAVNAFFHEERPDVVILAAARTGGILANATFPAAFIHDNLVIAANVIHAAHKTGVQGLLYCGASKIYPRFAQQPIRETALLTGTLDPSNEPDAIAAIAAIKLCESYNRQHGRDYRSVIPCGLYGPGDNFDPETAGVIPALIRRFHDGVQSGASDVTIWGTGTPRREFLHVNDMAIAALYILDLPLAIYKANTRPMLSQINIGSGREVSVRQLAGMIAQVTGFRGRILTDPEKPDGAPRRLLDCSLLTAMGWRPRIALEQGLDATYRWFLDHKRTARA